MRSIKVYYFNELSEEAKRKAIDAIIKAGLNWTDMDSEFLTEYFRQKLIDFGFDENVKIDWCLSYSQGDGVAFYGKLNALTILQNNKEEFKKDTFDTLMDNIGNIEIHVKRNEFGYRYSHYNTMDVCINYYGENEELEKAIKELEEVVKYLIKKLSVSLEQYGYDRIEESYTDDYIKELAIAYEFEFFEDGTLFR